ncbi:hypothetical protein [Nitrococcus mobilis]|uniref:hypothetical protein n=1 Tax=Nitrococcus mobilis TaxID=35797 RepID=UPI00058FCBD0|nr:hypothetical protein [Nitrococcus mobilis]
MRIAAEDDDPAEAAVEAGAGVGLPLEGRIIIGPLLVQEQPTTGRHLGEAGVAARLLGGLRKLEQDEEREYEVAHGVRVHPAPGRVQANSPITRTTSINDLFCPLRRQAVSPHRYRHL